ncbi:hypothetical protein PMI08_00049 [Brevibacillus sp. CF112]|uniref:Uncharacterized protein n=1 Tax=Brevibacillus agri TaxID=51101 RepID=A0A3M8AXV8_9BACL|nr:hypothetical protein PMI08_00049 [Brevibacillus sp. CF112]QAV11761.1 hypothetical protein BA6348_02590 [Brevibacillus agri]QHZ54250.1 hypothetical protein M655_000380 [Brevibacillus sp. NSP2.1]RNB56046.1 hypothetical protein EB820_10455 [Brevibacillus agri]
MIGNPATNLEVLKKTFGHAIQFIHDTDGTGMRSSIFAQRATIVFSDNSRLYVTEKLNKQHQTRFPNYYYNDLFSIVEGIFLFYLLPNKSSIK